jgi:hypothetical protein
MNRETRCQNCDRIHDSSYGTGRFCCQKCSRSFSTKFKRLEINQKVSEKLSLKKQMILKKCQVCLKDFYVSFGKRMQKSCSKTCSQSWKYHTNNSEKEKNLLTAQNAGKKSSKSQRSNRRSKNEKLFASMCQDKFENVLTNESIFNGWDSDVILLDQKIAVLWNGKWHYEKILKGTSVIQIQNRDRIKIKEIENLGFEPYIIKDMGKYNPAFVEEQFNIFLEFIESKKILSVNKTKTS